MLPKATTLSIKNHEFLGLQIENTIWFSCFRMKYFAWM